MRWAGVFAALILLPSAAAAQELGDPQAGHAYAVQVCAECHAVEPNEHGSPVIEATSFEKVANTPGMTGTALTVWMNTSHPNMPNLVLPQADLDNVIAYILSLKD